MSGEKKYWRLPTPFRKLSGRQDLRPNSRVVHSQSPISSVYLSDDTSTNGFVVVSEFDDSARSQTSHKEFDYAHYPAKFPGPAMSFSPPSCVNSYSYDLEDPTGLHDCGSYSSRDSGYVPISNASWDDDLSQRLGSAYEHIRSMPSASSLKVSLSSDPQMLRRQLGVPQHSVLNHPLHSSPDLPNPHTLPGRSTSPVAPPDDPYEKASNGSCINIRSHPTSPSCGSSDPFQPAQKHSVVNVPTLGEKALSQWRTLEVPRSSHMIACTPQSQLKLAKRRVEKPSTSFLPSTRRQGLKDVSRKPATNTLPPTNDHIWQIPLSQTRPHSPLELNIPLHHTWHDRRTNFRSTPERHSKRLAFHEPTSRQATGSTQYLAALAWVGTPPVTSSSEVVNHLASRAFLPDRLGMAIAVEDDSLSDDALVDRLERVRRIGGPPKHRRDIFSSPGQLTTPHDMLPPSPSITQDSTSDPEDTEVWQAARRALLCIREIVRTEKKYLEALKMLLNAQTATPPPPSMVPYISALVQASETLLRCFLEDLSAWGVSTAFVASEDELEIAMVSWCAVAGAFFMDGDDPQSSGLISRWRHRKARATSSPSSMTKQTSISLSPRLPSMVPIISTAGEIQGRMQDGYSASQHAQEKQISCDTIQKPEDTEARAPTGQPPTRKLSVRDLAIQPIQRVMRYVLLYRDLLDCTPVTSPSRLLVERALETAMRIADYCDRAQRNPAFFHAS